MNIDNRVAQILTDRSQFTARVRKLWTESAEAGDTKQVEFCCKAIAGDEDAAYVCAFVLAEAEGRNC